MENELIRYFLPDELLKHFEVESVYELCDISTRKMFFKIDLTERNKLSGNYDEAEYESKGFYEEKTVQDFPIRGKAVYLCIKRRRWRHKERKTEIVGNDYSFIAKGSKLTQELSDFLKGTSRDPGRYH
jgi:hypothetical protein